MMTLLAATRLIPSPPALVEIRNSLILIHTVSDYSDFTDYTHLWLVVLLKYLHQIFLVSAAVEPSIR